MTGSPSALLSRPAPPSPPRTPAPAPGASRLGRRPAPVEAAAVAVGTALTALHASRLGHWLVDDAAITFAYARSIDEGYGPVQQQGAEAVEGYSNPSWLLLLVLGRRLGLFDSGTSVLGVADLVWYPKLLALACVAGMLLAVTWAARAVFRPRVVPVVTLLAGAAVAGNFSLVAWLFSGLENPLYALAATVLAALAARAAALGTLSTGRTAAAAGLLALLAALTRPDGAACAAVYPVAALLFLRRGQARRTLGNVCVALGAFAVPYASFLLWRHETFGRWVPNTAVAKAQGAPELAQLAHTSGLLAYTGWLLVLALAGCAGLVVGRPGRARRALVAALVPLTLLLFAYGILNQDWMGLYRFATPVWAVGALAGSFALVAAWEGEGWRGRGALAAVTAAAVALSVAGREEPDARFEASPTVPMCFVVQRYGETFNTYADRLGVDDGVLALPDLGGTLLTTRLTVLDTAGLTDRAIADALAARKPGRVRDHVLRRVRPAFVHTHGVWSGRIGLTPEALTAHGYVPLTLRGANGDWVRRDAMRDPGALGRVQAWAQDNAERLDGRQHLRGGASCGDVLRAGRTR
ncbi:hypothetical protein [Streptomyces candidus]|uniref:Glycosyltransferase RgtA/B/C/D-like domain-containing protein n=1 Tax=Streptomyces candidus TaxID=67283 RepID=A0A7X0HCL7_9ACTN|nr:hypothetical protein [Streptomyces candidus]MBB6435171.1 hypothetical protein [Streptomyces candidus]GHH40598.1 hypothetical protein GCM10018773_21950 [Streptomyces candidus]